MSGHEDPDDPYGDALAPSSSARTPTVAAPMHPSLPAASSSASSASIPAAFGSAAPATAPARRGRWQPAQPTLTVLVQAMVGEEVVVELKTDHRVRGTLIDVDRHMGCTLRDVHVTRRDVRVRGARDGMWIGRQDEVEDILPGGGNLI